MKISDPPIIVEELINVKPDRVWEVLTQLNHMRKWFFEDIPDFKAEVGFNTDFVVSTEERSFDHRWKIIFVDVNRKLSYNWYYKGYSGDSNVHFELFPDKDKTLVRLTTEVLEDFPQHIPEFQRESCLGGWNYFIRQSLPKYISSLRD